jgi:hypothetical protein
VGGLACAPLGDGVSEVNDSRFRELVHQEFSSKQNRSAPLMSHGAVVFGIVCKMFENKKGFLLLFGRAREQRSDRVPFEVPPFFFKAQEIISPLYLQ